MDNQEDEEVLAGGSGPSSYPPKAGQDPNLQLSRKCRLLAGQDFFRPDP